MSLESSPQRQRLSTKSRWRPLLRPLRQPLFVISVLLLALAILCAVAPSAVAPFSASSQRLSARLLAPWTTDSAGHFHVLGTDWLGRDLLSRIISGTRITVALAMVNALVRTLFGSLLGLIGGFYGGLIDAIIMRLADIQLSLPFLLLGIALAAVSGPSVLNVVLVLGLTGWMASARVIRSEVLSLKQAVFVEAARATGARRMGLALRHILPNVYSSIIVLLTIDVPTVILAEAVLSFLGVGVPLSLPSWGAMVSLGRSYLATAWWIPVMPGAAIAILSASVTVVGDSLRREIDPTQLKGGRS